MVAIDALSMDLADAEVRDPQAPDTFMSPVASLGDVEVGVWAMQAGSAIDIEEDEIFVVLAGHARIDFLDADDAVVSVTELRPGTVCHLSRGTRTRWTVTTPLRKVYVTTSSPEASGAQEQ